MRAVVLGPTFFIALLSSASGVARADELKFVSHGPSIPFIKLGFEKVSGSGDSVEYKGNFGLFNAGAGYGVYFNVDRNNANTEADISIGVPVYLSVDKGNGAVSFAVSVNFFSNLLSVGVGVDMFRSGVEEEGTRDSGVLAWAFDAGQGWSRSNIFLLFSVGTNTGGVETKPGGAKVENAAVF